MDGMPSTFMTYSFSYDHYFSKFNSGFGLLGYKDAAGTGQLGTLSVGVQYSYNFKILQTIYARPGLHFSYREHGLAWDKLDYLWEIADRILEILSSTLKHQAGMLTLHCQPWYIHRGYGQE